MDNYLTRTIATHPGRAYIVMAVLVVLAIILIGATVYYARKCKLEYEGLAANQAMITNAGACAARVMGDAGFRAACGPGETPVSYHNADGSIVTYCRNTDALPGPPAVCGAGWDPAASAEAEALATVGSLQHEPYGERRLSRAIGAAHDASLGLSDNQLTSLMHFGGTP